MQAERAKLIIGDNRRVLASDLLSGFRGRIKMIYIDPPYNTKTAKSYVDNVESGEWRESIGRILQLLAAYLRDDGVIFISIDDNEYAQLRLLCDQFFGSKNFIGTFITRQAQRSNSKLINTVHEYILAYARDITRLDKFSIKRVAIPEQREMINTILGQVTGLAMLGIKEAEKRLQELICYYCEKFDMSWLKNYNCVDGNGEVYFASDLSVPGHPRRVDIDEINLHLEPLKTRGWVSDKRFIELHKSGLLAFRDGRPYCKKFLKDARDNAPSILNFYSRYGTRDLNRLGLRDLFDTPKPVELIKFLIRIANVGPDDYVMDCYAGSGTTGQAVIEVNLEDSKNIGFILIQRNERISRQTKIHKSCVKYNIEPDISAITRLRLNEVCKHNGIINNIQEIYYE